MFLIQLVSPLSILKGFDKAFHPFFFSLVFTLCQLEPYPFGPMLPFSHSKPTSVFSHSHIVWPRMPISYDWSHLLTTAWNPNLCSRAFAVVINEHKSGVTTHSCSWNADCHWNCREVGKIGLHCLIYGCTTETNVSVVQWNFQVSFWKCQKYGNETPIVAAYCVRWVYMKHWFSSGGITKEKKSEYAWKVILGTWSVVFSVFGDCRRLRAKWLPLIVQTLVYNGWTKVWHLGYNLISFWEGLGWVYFSSCDQY